MDPADDLATKRRLIADYETGLARTVAARVIEKPALSVWMILLPILLVHYLYRHQKFKAGTTEFAVQYLKPRMKALDVATGQAVSAAADGPPSRLYTAEQDYIAIVAAHFRRLLAASGDDYPSLVRSAYADRREYERYVADNNEACSAINDIVLEIGDPGEGFRDIVRHMEMVLQNLHRHETDRLFPG